MKIRTGFVSNSSSASFMVMLEDISSAQLYCLKNHIQFANSIGWDDYGCVTHDGEDWSVEVDGYKVVCDVFMDNFNLRKFAVEIIGISEDAIRDYDGPKRF